MQRDCQKPLRDPSKFDQAPASTDLQFMRLFQFQFIGDMFGKFEVCERDLALYEQGSGEKISDGLRVLNQVTDTVCSAFVVEF